jgi:hypothetical protein
MNSYARKIISLAALATVAVTGTASAATFGRPVVSGPGEHIPFNFAAFKEPADMKLPKNYRIVRVSADLAKGETSSTVLTAPQGFGIVTIGIGSGHQIGAAVKDVGYAGRRSVRVKVYSAKSAGGHGNLYILARRK